MPLAVGRTRHLTPSAKAAEVLRHRNKPKSKAFRDRFFPTYPSVCDVTKSTARAASPCLRGAVMYQLFTRMFTPEGTFKAAERKLPELMDLGVDSIYLTPHQLADDNPDPRHWSARQKACKHGNPKNPYLQKDFFAVNPEYGSKQDLKDFHWMRCFENHDFANVLPGEKRKEELYGAKINAAMIVTSFLLDGVPMLYNGVNARTVIGNRDEECGIILEHGEDYH